MNGKETYNRIQECINRIEKDKKSIYELAKSNNDFKNRYIYLNLAVIFLKKELRKELLDNINKL